MPFCRLPQFDDHLTYTTKGDVTTTTKKTAIGSYENKTSIKVAVSNKYSSHFANFANYLISNNTITAIAPKSAFQGATVTVAGTNFDAVTPANNIVFLVV